jgi:hypothetical protein
VLQTQNTSVKLDNTAVENELYARSARNFFPPCLIFVSTLAVNAFALLALSIKASPVNPEYTNAYLLSAVVTPSKYPTANLIPLIRKNALGGMYAGNRLRKSVRSVRRRMIVRISAERDIVPSEGPVERTMAAWIVCVDIGGGGRASGLFLFLRKVNHAGRIDQRGLTQRSTTLR